VCLRPTLDEYIRYSGYMSTVEWMGVVDGGREGGRERVGVREKK
jgi:hypothetical protein